MSITFGKYNRDVEFHLQQKDKDDIKRLLYEMSRNADNCERSISRLKSVMRSGSNKREMERIRQDLRDEVDLFTSLQNTLTSFVTLSEYFDV